MLNIAEAAPRGVPLLGVLLKVKLFAAVLAALLCPSEPLAALGTAPVLEAEHTQDHGQCNHNAKAQQTLVETKQAHQQYIYYTKYTKYVSDCFQLHLLFRPFLAKAADLCKLGKSGHSLVDHIGINAVGDTDKAIHAEVIAGNEHKLKALGKF